MSSQPHTMPTPSPAAAVPVPAIHPVVVAVLTVGPVLTVAAAGAAVATQPDAVQAAWVVALLAAWMPWWPLSVPATLMASARRAVVGHLPAGRALWQVVPLLLSSPSRTVRLATAGNLFSLLAGVLVALT